MKISSYFSFPNAGLYVVTLAVLLWAALVDVFFVPETETVFFLSFLWQFTFVFAGLIAVVLTVYCQRYSRGENLSNFFHWIGAFAAIYLVLCLCCNIKSLVFGLMPLRMDSFWIDVDAFLHFGFLPSVMAVKWIGDKVWVYEFLDEVYISWFFVMFFYLCFVILGRPGSHSRERYVFSFAALWLVAGNLMALAGASVGPVFLGDFMPPEAADAGEREVMAASAIFERSTQSLELAADAFKEILLEFVRNAVLIDPNGPSAMPSLHVGIAALMVFHSHGIHKALFAFMTAYYLLIFAGSIALQWHYAVDGYVATIIAFVIWKISMFLPRFEPLKIAILQS